jgi:DNA polymerase-3 subunit epsilon
VNPFPFPLQRPLTFFDLETTSKYAKTARIVEIAIVQYRPEEPPTEYWTLVNPGVPIPADVTAIHGIGDEHVLGKRRFEELAPSLIRAFQGCDFGGYNLRYDIEVLDNEFKRVGVDCELRGGQRPPRIIDGFRFWQLTHPRSLSDYIREMCGREHDGAHGAKADILGTVDAMVEHLQRYSDVLPADLDKLHALQWPPNPDAVDRDGKVVWVGQDIALSFGKYAQKPLRFVVGEDRRYLNWLRSTEMAADTRLLIDNALKGVYPTREVTA